MITVKYVTIFSENYEEEFWNLKYAQRGKPERFNIISNYKVVSTKVKIVNTSKTCRISWEIFISDLPPADILMLEI